MGLCPMQQMPSNSQTPMRRLRIELSSDTVHLDTHHIPQSYKKAPSAHFRCQSHVQVIDYLCFSLKVPMTPSNSGYCSKSKLFPVRLTSWLQMRGSRDHRFGSFSGTGNKYQIESKKPVLALWLYLHTQIWVLPFASFVSSSS